MKYIMGMHIKASSLKVGMFDLRGHFLHFWEENMDNHKPDHIVERLTAGVKHLVEYRGSKYENVAGAGITVAGQVDFPKGRVIDAPSLGWTNVPIVEMAEQSLKKPVFVDNIFNVIALAEMKHGAGWGQKNTVTVYFGDSLEIRVIKDGRLQRDKYEFSCATGGDCGVPENWNRGLFPELKKLAVETAAGVIVFHGLCGPENEQYWKKANLSWHRHAGKNMPDILPAELGEEAPLSGAAILVSSELK